MGSTATDTRHNLDRIARGRLMARRRGNEVPLQGFDRPVEPLPRGIVRRRVVRVPPIAHQVQDLAPADEDHRAGSGLAAVRTKVRGNA